MAHPAVEAARARRAGASDDRLVRTEWFIDKVVDKVTLTMKERVGLATMFLQDKVVRNISRPVTKTRIPGSLTLRVTDRSKPGEFPKADTTLLMKTIFGYVEPEVTDGHLYGYVGTPLDYGLILETSQKLDRSFLLRTLNEERDQILRILSGPISGMT